ncbi:MAG: aldo/keto reductase [Proteobacteria bacterium]|nr:aldo/keto reductase [Desulfobulbaceae bacterium]MBU4153230.1 aldo/keto reductase [Pseudomonadota bacterium]
MVRCDKFSRRTFVGGVLSAAAVAGIGPQVANPLTDLVVQAAQCPVMPSRPLGQTGYDVRIFSLGGQATLEKQGTEAESLAIISRALDLGVNYIDTAAAYGNGQSERHFGAVLKSRRKQVFLASKTHSKSYDGSMRLLEQSLKNLNTDHLDLWQLHNVRTQSDLDAIFAADGAIKALEEARAQKMVRFLGITGHFDPLILKKALEQYPFNTILMPLNAADKHEKSFIDILLPVAVQKGMGVIGMKVPARGRIFRENGVVTMETAMRYVLTLPVSSVIIGISTLDELEENVRIAEKFVAMTPEEMRKTEELTKPYFKDATWFKQHW